MNSNYTAQQQARINQLLESIRTNPVPMAVVDYNGMIGSDFKRVEADDPERFGVRDMRHVKIYKLHVVVKNH